MILPRTYHRHQSTGRLVELPVNLPLPTTEVYVVCAKTMRWVPRVQAVIQELRELLLSVEGVTDSSSGREHRSTVMVAFDSSMDRVS